MSKPKVLISIKTFQETGAKACGRAFVEALAAADHRLLPEQVKAMSDDWSAYEEEDSFIEKWWAISAELRVDGQWNADFVVGPDWRRKSSIASRGEVKHTGRTNRGSPIPGSIWFESRWDSKANFDRLFEMWSGAFKPEFGILHVFTDLERSKPASEAERQFELGMGGGAKDGLPNLAWATILGARYRNDFDHVGARDAGFKVVETDSFVLVRVTNTPSEIVENFDYFTKRRRALKSYFPPGYFWVDREES